MFITTRKNHYTSRLLALSATLMLWSFAHSQQPLPQLQPPKTDGITFSHPAGFCYSPFDLVLSTTSGYKIIYTTDGSNPMYAAHADTVDAGAVLRVDPERNDARGQTPVFVVRASLYKPGYQPAFPQSASYIFIESVQHQANPGGEWPEVTSGWPPTTVNGQVIDYQMAADVVTDKKYASMLSQALLQIPSIVIATDVQNLFDANNGIYVNASQKGADWERDCSIELINPNGSKGFQINAGLRIRGGNSAKNGYNPKHGLRLFFREQYGKKKLKYPLFGSEGTSEFESIDLRCEQNYSWSMDGDTHSTFIKDIFCRALQGKMGQPYSRGRYYHVYLNGMYWGLYQTDERPEASFAEAYMGGEKKNYDVIKVNTQPWPYYNEATDGNMEAWSDLWNLCKRGFTSNDAYFYLEGKDASGVPVKNSKVFVDIDNLIDYMLVIFYSGNFDAPVSAWHSNNMPNNFFAIYDRTNKSQGFKFVGHDAEHCMFVDKVNYGDINIDRVNIGTAGKDKMYITDVLSFNPQWLHFKLSKNTEYRLRFADRASSFLTNGGVLSPEKTAALFKFFASQIDTAIIAESARWGDAQSATSLTRDDAWLPELTNLYNSFFPVRSDIVTAQLKEADLYTTLAMPVVKLNATTLYDNQMYFATTTTITIENTNSSGMLYYTTNGTDPRAIGGNLAESALPGNNLVQLTISATTPILARIKDGSTWGSLRHITLSKQNENFASLKVTELCYHPSGQIIGADTLDDKNFEFIELKNTGSSTLDISGIRFDSAVTYTVPYNTLLQPQAFYVVAAKPNYFYSRYGIAANGNYQGQFANSGEYLTITDKAGKTIISFTYDDGFPWPTAADGSRSLVSAIANPTGNPNDVQYWQLSRHVLGSPFADDSTATAIHATATMACSVYPNPTNDLVHVQLKNQSNKTIELQLFNIDGRSVHTATTTSTSATLDLEGLGITHGIYLLKITVAGSSTMEKIVYTE